MKGAVLGVDSQDTHTEKTMSAVDSKVKGGYGRRTPHLLDMYTQSDCRMEIPRVCPCQGVETYMEHEAAFTSRKTERRWWERVGNDMADQLTGVEFSLSTSADQYTL